MTDRARTASAVRDVIFGRLNISQAARTWGVHVRNVRRALRRAGYPPQPKIGRPRRPRSLGDV